MRAAAIIGLLLAGCGVKSVDPCAGVAGACLAVHIDPSSDVDKIDAATLQITAGGQTTSLSSSFTDGKARSLPVAIGVSISDTTTGDSVQLDLVVVGSLGGSAVGSATASRTLVRGQHDSVHVKLSRGGEVDLGDDSAVDDLGEVDLTDGATPTYPLTVAVTGNGAVTATPLINCPGTCTDNYAAGTMVTLTAAAGSDSLFGSWGGDCKGFASTCMVTMDQAKSVTAQFGLKTVVTVTYSATVPSVGTITSSPPGITCPGTCSAEFAQGSTITLTGTPTLRTGSWFSGWTGDCTPAGPQPVCSLLVNAAKAATGSFVPVNYMFVTSINKALPYSSDEDGTEFAATTLCNFLAEQNGMALTTGKWWRPWLSFSTNVRAPDVAATPINASHEILRGTPAMPTNGAYISARGWIRADNRPFADDVASFTNKAAGSDNKIFYLPNVDEKGATVPLDTWVMTGTAGSGQYPGGTVATCTVGGVDYQPGNATMTNFIGLANAGSSAWTIAFQGPNRPLCNSANIRLYCFQNDYTTTIVPPRIKGRYAFISLANWDPSLGLANADQLCHDEAVAGNLMQGDAAAVWKAALGTTTASAASRFTTVGRMNWVRPDGVQVTLHPADLFDLSTQLLAAPNLGSDGTHYMGDSDFIWTGSDGGFAAVGTTTCNDWKVGGVTGASGMAAYANKQMAYASGIPSNCMANQSHLLCLQDSDPP